MSSPLREVGAFCLAAWLLGTCARLQDLATAADRIARASERAAQCQGQKP